MTLLPTLRSLHKRRYYLPLIEDKNCEAMLNASLSLRPSGPQSLLTLPPKCALSDKVAMSHMWLLNGKFSSSVALVTRQGLHHHMPLTGHTGKYVWMFPSLQKVLLDGLVLHTFQNCPLPLQSHCHCLNAFPHYFSLGRPFQTNTIEYEQWDHGFDITLELRTETVDNIGCMHVWLRTPLNQEK